MNKDLGHPPNLLSYLSTVPEKIGKAGVLTLSSSNTASVCSGTEIHKDLGHPPNFLSNLITLLSDFFVCSLHAVKDGLDLITLEFKSKCPKSNCPPSKNINLPNWSKHPFTLI